MGVLKFAERRMTMEEKEGVKKRKMREEMKKNFLPV